MRQSILALLLALAVASPAHAASFGFDITFDGISATLDGSSDPVNGTTLSPGDTFTLDVHAAGNALWLVNTNAASSLYATFATSDSATREADVTTTLLLDGIVVDSAFQTAFQSFAHVGGQTFSFTAGTSFDQLVIEWDFVGITSGTTTTLLEGPDVLHFSPFYGQSYVTYVVPEPSTGLLLSGGLLGLVIRRRYQRDRCDSA